MRLNRTALCLLFCAMAGLTGCTWFNQDRGPLISALNTPIADVPVPAGFTMTDQSTSTVVPGESRRVVDHRYKGYDGVLPIIKFYRDRMPERGWTWIDQDQSQGNEITLHFTKNNETCTVIAWPGTFANYIRVKIEATGGK